jgi:hypothetical protein
MDKETIDIIAATVIVFLLCGTCFYYIGKAQIKVLSNREKINTEFQKVLQEHKNFLEVTPCNDDSIQEFELKSKELLDMEVPRWGNCQPLWAMRFGQYNYAIAWYKKSKGGEIEFIK